MRCRFAGIPVSREKKSQSEGLYHSIGPDDIVNCLIKRATCSSTGRRECRLWTSKLLNFLVGSASSSRPHVHGTGRSPAESSWVHLQSHYGLTSEAELQSKQLTTSNPRISTSRASHTSLYKPPRWGKLNPLGNVSWKAAAFLLRRQWPSRSFQVQNRLSLTSSAEWSTPKTRCLTSSASISRRTRLTLAFG